VGIIVDATIQAFHVRLGTAPDTTPGRRSHRPHLQISRNGKRTTLVRGLPSDQTSPAVGGTVSGVADVTFIGVTFIGHRLYACWAGAAAHWWTLASGPTD
jgi:hypothetical protein